ncbi:tetratricopeptide repeat protein [Brevibacillus laterosporus]|uniref:Tetratricopeptide repeat protein n=1 Tax=Brevibacillus laterosporus TaxID=1465 RepID=A0A518V8S8_BRELA|nr:tetratricopeptide repeat protein [Brevibacillus laterosporus]
MHADNEKMYLVVNSKFSKWKPCPIMSQIVNDVLQIYTEIQAYSQRIEPTLEIPVSLVPFINPLLRKRLGLFYMPSLTPDNNDHPEEKTSYQLIQCVANVIRTIQKTMQQTLVLVLPAGLSISKTDRLFLKAVDKHVTFKWYEQDVREQRSDFPDKMYTPKLKQAKQTVSFYTRRITREQRLLSLIIGGIDRALQAAFYHEANRKIVMATRLFRRMGPIPYSLKERQAFVYLALQQHQRAIKHLFWLVEHARTPIEGCHARISLAAQLITQDQQKESFEQARRCLAEVKQLEREVVGTERILLESMRLNTTALLLYRRKKYRSALQKLERAFATIDNNELVEKYAGQVSIVSDNAVRITLLLYETKSSEKWATRLSRAAQYHDFGKIRASKVYAKLEKWEEAKDWATKALEENVAQPELYINRALCLYHLKEYKRMLQDVERAEAYGKQDIEIILLKATVMEELDKKSEAIDYYQQAICINPHHVHAWIDMARLYWDIGETRDATVALTQAIMLDPSREDVREWMNMLQHS